MPAIQIKNIFSRMETIIYNKYCNVKDPSEIAKNTFIKINTKVWTDATAHNKEILLLIILLVPLGVVSTHSISEFDFNL